MVRCDTCGTDAIGADGRCANGHDQVREEVVQPVTVGATAAGVTTAEPAGDSVIRLRPVDDAGDSSALLSEAFGALSALEDALAPPERPVAPGPPPPPVAAEPVAPEPPVAATTEEPETEAAVLSEAPPHPAPPHPAPEIPSSAPGPLQITPELFGKPRSRARSRTPRALLIVPVILAVLGGTGAFVLLGSPAAEAAVYRRVFTAGQTHTYRFEMSMDGTVSAGAVDQDMRMTMEMAVTEETVKVHPDGSATIRQSITGVRASLDGAPAPVPDLGEMTVTVRMAPDGRVLDVEGLGGLGFGQTGPATELFGPTAFGPLLSSDRVAPGDEWTVTEEIPNPLLDEPFRLTARNRLVKRSQTGGVETALIRSHVEAPMDMSISVADMLAKAEELTGESAPEADLLPSDAVFVYEGLMTMDLLQTVEVATGRAVSVSGTGDADFTMRMEGIPGSPEVRMRLRLDASITPETVASGARVAGTGDELQSALPSCPETSPT